MGRSALHAILLVSSVAIVAEPALAAPPGSGLAAGARNRVTGKLCEPARSVPAARREAPSARKLGELPAGNVVLTVVRDVDGCAAPVIVRHGLGSGGASVKAKRSAGTAKAFRH